MRRSSITPSSSTWRWKNWGRSIRRTEPIQNPTHDLLREPAMIDMIDYGHDTIVMKPTHVSKSRFKAHALELFRQVEQSGHPIVITDRGIPVLRLAPYKDDLEAALASLKGSVLEYVDPMEPVDELDMDFA